MFLRKKYDWRLWRTSWFPTWMTVMLLFSCCYHDLLMMSSRFFRKRDGRDSPAEMLFRGCFSWCNLYEESFDSCVSFHLLTWVCCCRQRYQRNSWNENKRRQVHVVNLVFFSFSLIDWILFRCWVGCSLSFLHSFKMKSSVCVCSSFVLFLCFTNTINVIFKQQTLSTVFVPRVKGSWFHVKGPSAPSGVYTSRNPDSKKNSRRHSFSLCLVLKKKKKKKKREETGEKNCWGTKRNSCKQKS